MASEKLLGIEIALLRRREFAGVTNEYRYVQTYSLAIDRARALLGSIARCARTPRPRAQEKNFHDQDSVVKKRREVLVMAVMAVYTRL